VTFVSPLSDAAARTTRVRIELENEDSSLRPGMRAQVELRAEPRSVLTVPADAIVDTGRQTYVFVETAPGRFEPRGVEVGGQLDGLVEIRAGLELGEKVAHRGTFLIDSESRIRGLAAEHDAQRGSP
jgi:Cu(I)/Ag(I) efflux system membrane fusion protein